MCFVRLCVCYIFIVTFAKHGTEEFFSFGVDGADPNSTDCDDKDRQLICNENELNQTSCELTQDQKTAGSSNFVLCEGKNGWKQKKPKGFRIHTNVLNVSNLELKTIYHLSVCSKDSITLDDIAIKSDFSNNRSSKPKGCHMRTYYTLQLLPNNTIRIKNSKQNKDFPMDTSTTSHTLQILTKSKSNRIESWKLRKPKIIEATKSNNNSCVIQIKYTGTLRVTMFVYLHNESLINVTATTKGTNDSTIIIRDHSQEWKKAEFTFVANNQANLTIGRKCDGDCSGDEYWAISEVKILTDCKKDSKTNLKRINGRKLVYPIVLEPPWIEHISDDTITIRVKNLTYAPVEAKPQIYIIQYKQDQQKFENFGNLTKREDVLDKTFQIQKLSTRKYQYTIRLLLSDDQNNYSGKEIPELTTYKRSLSLSQLTNNSFTLSWHAQENAEYKCSYTCTQEFCNKYLTSNEESCKTPFKLPNLKPSTKCSVMIYILNNQRRWQLYDEENVTTHTAKTIDENEMPDNVSYKNNKIMIPFKSCIEFNGPINYHYKYRCTSPWCKKSTDESIGDSGPTYKLQFNKEIKLQAFSNYSITVKATRNNKKKSKIFTLETPPTKPNPVRNLTIYCRNNEAVWLQWISPYPPTGHLSKYVITQKGSILKKSPISDYDVDGSFVCPEVQLKDNKTRIMVHAENSNVEEPGEGQPIEISSVPYAKEAIQNFTVVPSSKEISLRWSQLYLNALSVQSKNVENCTQSCEYKIPIEDNFTVTVSSLNCESEEATIKLETMPAPPNLSNNPLVEVCSELHCNLYVPVPNSIMSTGRFNLSIIKKDDGSVKWTVEDLQQENNYIKVEIGPGKAVSLKNLKNQTYAMSLHDIDKNRCYPLFLTEEQDWMTLPVLCLLIMIPIAVICLGYLVFAYFFKKYPFDLDKGGTPKKEHIFSKETNQLSEHYKSSRIKTIRKKADPPPKMPELEILIEPSTSKPETKSTSIDVKDFEDYLMTSLGEDPYSNDLTSQYRKLPKDYIQQRSVGLQNKNVHKNRYKNLIAFDNSRVILKDNGDSDYINANYVNGYENPKAFIATQAPLKTTLGDFWCMIWQEKVNSIIMLTELVENGTVKCEQYWPDLHQKARFGEILISTVSIKVFSDYVFRELQVSRNSESRTVHHLQYTTWPDHGVPSYPQNFTPFVKRLLAKPQNDAPIVVHCNAGCGRTGTLILCDIILRMAAKEGCVDFVKALTKIRAQRINLVHNVNQYVFAHFVVLECLFGVDFSIPINDSFQNEVFKVLRKTTIKPLMEQLDNVMMQFKKRQLCFTTNMSDDDKKKNRFSRILPGHAQIFLPPSSENPSSYINAIIADCYRCPRKFIVTQQPLSITVDDFWTLVKEYEVNTIVSLNEIDGKDPNCPKFWQRSKTTSLQIIEEIEDRAYDITKVKVSDPSDSTTEKTVNVIKMKKWPRETPYPTNPKDLIMVWKETFSSSWKGDSQIVVTCYDGATASGLFIALAYLIEKMNYEQVCDVFSAIRTVRQSREEFVQEWGQLEFLHKAAKVYIEEFDNYDNFD